MNGAMTFNSGEALVAAAAAGLGVIQVAEDDAWPLIDSGGLVELLRDYKTEGHDISVVFPQQRRVAPKLRVFVDFLVALFDPPPWKRLVGADQGTQGGAGSEQRAGGVAGGKGAALRALCPPVVRALRRLRSSARTAIHHPFAVRRRSKAPSRTANASARHAFSG